LATIKKEFEGGEEESVKVVELKRLEQEGRIIKKFVQEFRRAARESRYKGRLLIEEFKREMNGIIKKKLMKAERPPMLWQPLDTQGPMILLMSKPQRRSLMWEFTRELDKESLLN